MGSMRSSGAFGGVLELPLSYLIDPESVSGRARYPITGSYTFAQAQSLGATSVGSDP